MLVLLVLGGGALFTILQGTETTCVSTTSGPLTEQSTYGQGQSSGCGTIFSSGYDYIIGSGTFVNWSGFEGPIAGNVEVVNGGTLDINGNVTFGGTLTNAGTVTVQPQAAAPVKPAPTSNFYTISDPSGHTTETGTSSTFDVKLNAKPTLSAAPPAPTVPSSDFFEITNISGHTSETGTNSTFDVVLNAKPIVAAAPSAPSAPISDIFDISNISGHTKEDGTTSTFNVALKDDSHFPSNPSSSSAPSSDFYSISAPSNSGHTEEDGTTSTFNVALKDDSHFPSTPAAPISNNHNKALDFDGVNDYVTTPIDADLQAMPSTTWSGWINSYASSGYQIIFGMEDGGWDRFLIIKNGL